MRIWRIGFASAVLAYALLFVQTSHAYVESNAPKRENMEFSKEILALLENVAPSRDRDGVLMGLVRFYVENDFNFSATHFLMHVIHDETWFRVDEKNEFIRYRMRDILLRRNGWDFLWLLSEELMEPDRSIIRRGILLDKFFKGAMTISELESTVAYVADEEERNSIFIDALLFLIKNGQYQEVDEFLNSHVDKKFSRYIKHKLIVAILKTDVMDALSRMAKLPEAERDALISGLLEDERRAVVLLRDEELTILSSFLSSDEHRSSFYGELSLALYFLRDFPRGVLFARKIQDPLKRATALLRFLR